MYELIKSLFFNIFTLDNVIRFTCIIIGLIYIYIKYRFKLVYMPSYLYEYDKDLVDEDIYDEIISTYANSIFILTAIEGMIIIILLIQYFISPSITIEISQSRGFIL